MSYHVTNTGNPIDFPSTTKHYFVIYKSYQKPGLEHFEVDATNKAEARRMFLEQNIKHDYIIKVIL
jgi:hypothetical protein